MRRRRIRRPRSPCIGAVHVVPVPPGMTVEQVWAETTTLGRLAYPPQEETDVGWAVYECPGRDECRCRFIDLAPNYRKYVNDRLVAAKVRGVTVPRLLLPVVTALSRRP
jgi:hypothetical protein